MRMTGDASPADDYAAQTAAFLDCLVERLDPAADPQAFPDLLTSLSWTNDDNGHAIELVRRGWLRTGDRARATIAMAMTETFPGGTRDELAGNVSAAADRFPELREQAEAILERWDAQIEPKRRGAGTTGSAEPVAPPPAGQPMTIADTLAFIAEHPAAEAPPKFLSEIIDELLPCLRADAQAEVFAVRDRWLGSDDDWRVAIAVWMEVPGPGESTEDLVRRRTDAIARVPRVAAGDDGWKWTRW
jgi:hypothetical protein